MKPYPITHALVISLAIHGMDVSAVESSAGNGDTRGPDYIWIGAGMDEAKKTRYRVLIDLQSDIDQTYFLAFELCSVGMEPELLWRDNIDTRSILAMENAIDSIVNKQASLL